jgi:hypothetical protein
VGVVFIKHLAGIEQHGAVADVWKFLLDLIVLQHRVLRDDLSQEGSQGRDVPLTVAERIEQLTVRFFAVHAECKVERPARRDDAKLLVEHQ